MTTPATPRTTHALTYCEPCGECESKVNAHDALLAALRRLSDMHEAGAASDAVWQYAWDEAAALLRDLSPEEEGQ